MLEKYQDLSFSKLLVAEAYLTKEFEVVRFSRQLALGAFIALITQFFQPLLEWKAWEFKHCVAVTLWMVATLFLVRFHISYVRMISELKLIARLIEKGPT
jgi:hypothetical protein